MDTCYKKYVLIVIIILLATSFLLAQVNYNVLKISHNAPNEYNQKNEQEYREAVQLKIQELEKRIKYLEKGD